MKYHSRSGETSRRGGRAAEGAPLLREYGLITHRGFESLPLRHPALRVALPTVATGEFDFGTFGYYSIGIDRVFCVPATRRLSSLAHALGEVGTGSSKEPAIRVPVNNTGTQARVPVHRPENPGRASAGFSRAGSGVPARRSAKINLGNRRLLRRERGRPGGQAAVGAGGAMGCPRFSAPQNAH